MKAVRQTMTSLELALAAELRDLGMTFQDDVRLAELGTRRADFAFCDARLAVFVDGCFWHGCLDHGTWPTANAAWWRAKIEANQRRDADTDARLRAAGWRLLRVWGHEAPSAAASRILTALRGGPGPEPEPAVIA